MFHKCITGHMILSKKDVVLDDVDFCGLALRGDIPLSPRTKAFLESRGAKVTQDNDNEKITFVGDLFHTFSREEIIGFLTQRLSAPTPRL